MGKASELIGQSDDRFMIEGSFECHVCGVCVDEAEKISSKKILTWTCENGHRSQIEVQW